MLCIKGPAKVSEELVAQNVLNQEENFHFGRSPVFPLRKLQQK